MRRHKEVHGSLQFMEYVVAPIIGAFAGAIANIIIAPLTPFIQNWEIQTWFWLIQNHSGLKQLSWGEIILSISFLLGCIIALLVFLVFAYINFVLSSSRKRPYFPWEKQPNPWSWRNQQ